MTRKDVQNVHLTVHPPAGNVSLVIPKNTRLDVARAYAATRIGWIRRKQDEFQNQLREEKRRYVSGESHFVWGKRRLFELQTTSGRTQISLASGRLVMKAPKAATEEQRANAFQRWSLAELHRVVPSHIDGWEQKLGVRPKQYFLQRMKTKWGSCNHAAQTIRLNSELLKKPRDLLDYVILHEMVHLIEPRHSERFFILLSTHCPGWQEARRDLNELPIPA